jgi:integrase
MPKQVMEFVFQKEGAILKKAERLTDLQVKALKPQDKRYMKYVDDSLYIEVFPNGTKSWRVRCRQTGAKEVKLSLGEYPLIPLAEARDKCTEIRKGLVHGGVPKEILKPATFPTFGALAEEWYKQQLGAWSATHLHDVRHKLDAFLLPQLAARPVREITSQEILKILLTVEYRAPESAYKAKLVVGQVLRYAIAKGEADFDVTTNLRGALKPRKHKHFASVTNPKDVSDLMIRIEAYQGTFVVKSALWFSLYTFQRPGEIRRAEWKELDFDAALWRLPEKRMKAGLPHIVPLSRQALVILEVLKPVIGHGKFVFPSLKSQSIPMSENTIRVALRSMGYSNGDTEDGSLGMTPHGFRSLASTNLHEMGFDTNLVELQLAHTDENAVRAAYNYAERLDARREMMQTWADWLDRLKRKITDTLIM